MRSILLRNRRWITEALAALLVAAALSLAFVVRFEFGVPPAYLGMLVNALPLAVVLKLAVFRVFGLRHLGWRYVGFEDLLRIAGAHAVASAAVLAALRWSFGPAFPRSIYVLDFLLCLLLDVGARALIRVSLGRGAAGGRPGPGRRTLIYGAGAAGLTVLRELRANPGMGCQVVGFLDDDPAKRSMRIHGLRVLGGRGGAESPSGGHRISEVARKHRIEEILIAMPTASGQAITEILEQARASGAAARRVPALAELIGNRVLVDQIREVRIEDLLGRPPVHLDPDRVRARIEGRVVLVTGAGGSIGSELCRQLARYRPAALIGFDHAETALYEIEQEIAALTPDLAFHPEVGSVQSRARLGEVFARYRPAAVYHAAAYKHVPMMETHLFEAVKNNIFGTRNVARTAVDWGARDFVLISSDKAVRPANVMGATKRVAEMVALAEAERPSRLMGAATKTVAVRFGNVLGSSGSVIPLFRRQIARGGPVTVTHPDMRRFFMTIPEAAQLVLEAGAMGGGGEIFVLEMGEPVRIVDLARKMILLSGLRPEVDIPIVFSGTRPGEKLYEELSAYQENTVATPHAQIRVLSGPALPAAELSPRLEQLRSAVRGGDLAGAVMSLKELVEDYNPSTGLLRLAWATQPDGNAATSRERPHPWGAIA